MKIWVFAIGKPSGKSEIFSLFEQFQKKVQRYLPFQMVWIKESKLPTITEILLREGEALLRATDDFSYRIAVTIQGKLYSSEQWAKQIQSWQNTSKKEVAFLIGGPYGFSPKVFESCHEQWSLSPLTFTHEMAQLLFLEQIYRAMTIIRGEPYHK